MRKPFPFIVGRGRSGTTLLRSMFDAHPQMAVPPESHFLVSLGRKHRRYERGRSFAVERFVADLSREYGFRRWGLDARSVLDRLSGLGVETCSDAIRDVFSMYAERVGKERYAEKTPMNVIHMPFLGRAFPEAHFIHLIRDGRDVALSYLDTDFGVESLGEAAIYWDRFVRKGRSDGLRLGPRYREIRYEDLLADPEEVLRSLCEFVALHYDAAMLEYHRRADALLASTPRAEHHQRLRLPPTAGLRDWRTQMDRHSLLLFEALAGDLLDELGYERWGGALGASAKLKARGTRVVILARRVGARIRKGVRGRRATPRRKSHTGPVGSTAPSLAGQPATRRSP